jgi:hypothetical protein
MAATIVMSALGFAATAVPTTIAASAAMIAAEQAAQSVEQVAAATLAATVVAAAGVRATAIVRRAAIVLRRTAAAIVMAATALGLAAIRGTSTFWFTTTTTAAAEHRVQERSTVALAAEAQTDDHRTGKHMKFHRATSPLRGEPVRTRQLRLTSATMHGPKRANRPEGTNLVVRAGPRDSEGDKREEL